MRLTVLLPTEILVDEEVAKVVAEAQNGSFCLLPRHIDFVAALVPGLLSFVKSADGAEEFLAADEGLLVKCGPQVLVSTRQAVRGGELGLLRETVEKTFKVLTDQEKRTRTALANLEANFIRRLLKLEEYA
ncbi:MAG: F0F1 ATP synthase subunit epsilon [Desulfobaccales bacterium]